MKIFNFSQWTSLASRLLAVSMGLFPSYLSAHPGHYHPDETDEFDFLRATFFHSHGAVDYIFLGVAVSAVLVACFHGKSSVRIGAVLMALGSLLVTRMV